MTDMPDPCQSSISLAAWCKTASGSAAGPALKLKTRVIEGLRGAPSAGLHGSGQGCFAARQGVRASLADAHPGSTQSPTGAWPPERAQGGCGSAGEVFQVLPFEWPFGRLLAPDFLATTRATQWSDFSVLVDEAGSVGRPTLLAAAVTAWPARWAPYSAADAARLTAFTVAVWALPTACDAELAADSRACPGVAAAGAVRHVARHREATEPGR